MCKERQRKERERDRERGREKGGNREERGENEKGALGARRSGEGEKRKEGERRGRREKEKGVGEEESGRSNGVMEERGWRGKGRVIYHKQQITRVENQ